MAAIRNDDLLGRIVEPVVALELGRDGLTELEQATGRRVVMFAGLQRLHGGCYHAWSGVEIGIPAPEWDQVVQLRRDPEHARPNAGLDAHGSVCQVGLRMRRHESYSTFVGESGSGLTGWDRTSART